MIYRLILLVLDILVILCIASIFVKMVERSKSDKKRAPAYWRDITIGMVSGLVVVVLDKGVEIIFQGWPKVEGQSLSQLAVSMFDGFLLVFFEFGLVIFLVLVALYMGFSKFYGKKKK